MSGPVPIPVIAIDGPSASGKGTVAHAVARRLGFHYLDSGAIYRALAVAARLHDVALDDEPGLAALARAMSLRFEGMRVWLEQDDRTDAVRSEQAGNDASAIAALPQVRAALLELQRGFRRAPGLVADGRDMGSVVFPDARLKVFLTATPQVRAERRYKQLMEKGIRANLSVLLRDIELRDARDASRSVAPLRMSADASPLDTTDIAPEAAVDIVVERFQQAL